MKYTLLEIREMLLEPSFDMEGFITKTEFTRFMFALKEAIVHHEQLSNNNNAENQ
jgi:hypothetical protein